MSTFRHLLPILPLLFSSTVTAEAITVAPNLHRMLARQDAAGPPASGFSSCDAFSSVLDACQIATPNIASLPFTSAASCYCYSSSTYKPAVYDNAIVTCLEFFSTADPSYYSSLASTGLQTAPCKALGNFASLSSSGTESTLASASGSLTKTGGDANKVACSSWFDIFASCNAKIPSLTALPFTAEASCLCYTGSIFAPSVYDKPWGSCVQYYKTASPAFYTSSIGVGDGVMTPCASVGDVRATTSASSTSSTAAASSAASAATPTSTTPTATTTALTTTVSTTPAKGIAPVITGSKVLGTLIGLSIFLQLC